MLHRLCGGQEASIEGDVALVLLHDFIPFREDAFDGVTGPAPRRLADDLKHLLEALDLALGLLPVLLERRLQFGRLGCTGHLGQGFQDLAFGVIDVTQGIVKQVFKRLLGHGSLRLGEASEKSGSPACS
ncbi:hypothetical protein D3C87_1698730 [compost metagenome]